MGLPWWVCFTTLIPVIGFFAALWLGIAKPSIKFAQETTAAEQPPNPPGQLATAKAAINTLLHRLPVKFQTSKKRIIIGAGIGVLLVAAVITALAVALTEDRPDRATLAKCDNELRTQLNSPELPPDVPNANAAVKAIQEQRAESCRADFWNPLVTDFASDYLGNIEVTFSTKPSNVNGAAVTTPAEGSQRWVYLAEKEQWYSSKLGEPSVLDTTINACDAWLREKLASPKVSSAQNANAAIKAIQDNSPNQCAPSAWNPVVRTTAKDHVGNIDVQFWKTKIKLQGTAVTMPAEGSQRWVYLAEKEQWYSSKLDETSILDTTITSTSLQTTPSPTARPAQNPIPTRRAQTPAADNPDSVTDFDYIGEELFTGTALTEASRGEELFLQGEYRAAIQAYQLARDLKNQPSAVLENRIGMALQAMGNHPQAIAHFTTALDIEDSPGDRTNRAVSYLETGQCTLAIQDAQKALDMEHEAGFAFHTDAEAHAILAACQISENPHRAIEHAEKALNLAKSTGYPAEELASLHVTIGAAHYLLDSYSEAIRHYSHAITLNDSAEARSSRAWAYWSAEDCASAIEDSLEATAMLPVTSPGYHTEAEGHIVLLTCFSEQDKWSEALPHAEAALLLMHANDYDPEYIELIADDVLFLRRTTTQ